MATNISLLKPLGYQRRSTCGYCKKSSGNSSYYLACDKMRVDHYQALVDRGWRRSGTTYYKPDLPNSCCPHYTIRLEANIFKPTRDQRQCVNRWNDFILGAEYKHKAAQLCPQTKEEKRQKRDSFDLLEAIHRTEYDQVNRPVDRRTTKPIEPAHKFEISIESDQYTKEKHDIFLKYQIEIHKDPPSRWKKESFKRFLCDGLDRKTLKIDGKTMKLGSYHQCYRLDGRLVAVGVLDLLPHAVSSVYLFYDPEFGEWDFGKLSALREIALAIESKYEWYYMGYYIHSCIKMRYKGNFQPSYLLDPESLEWNLLNDVYRQKLDQRRYVSPSKDLLIGEPASQTTPSEIEYKQDSASSKGVDDSTTSGVSVEADDLEIDSDPSDVDDTDVPDGSLFDYNIPGVLSKEEVRKLDIDHWKLLVRMQLVEFEDIRGWEQQRIDDPHSIKGIAAELIAATGPELLENSAVILF